MGGWFCASVAAENERWSRWLGGRVRCPKSAALSVQRAGQGGSAELESSGCGGLRKEGKQEEKSLQRGRAVREKEVELTSEQTNPPMKTGVVICWWSKIR